jgi:hypothetical protein
MTALLPPAVAELFTPRLADLGPGTPNQSMRTKLAAFTLGKSDTARCVHSLLWLHHDFLDESHEISQGIDTPAGSYLHAIMHRREPDAFNSKYWWRRVGSYPVFAEVATAATELGYLKAGEAWDPYRFVDDCEAARGRGGEREELLKRVQAAEMQALLAWCVRML